VGRARAVDLGVLVFRTMKEAHDYFHVMLQSYAVGDRVSSAHAAALTGLLNRHPDHLAKIGVGISHFKVMAADFGSQCFAVHRIDGSYEDFSYTTCITEGRY
jgi:hypothetical protein